jgi:hypothetical protein
MFSGKHQECDLTAPLKFDGLRLLISLPAARASEIEAELRFDQKTVAHHLRILSDNA